MLLDVLDYPSKEAAKALGVTAGTVRGLASRARATCDERSARKHERHGTVDRRRRGTRTFPNDAFERMLRRHDRRQRNQRLAAAGVGVAVVVAVALAIGSFDRPPTQPLVPTAPLDEITFWFDYDGDAPHHRRLYVNGVEVEGTMSNTPQEAYLYVFDPEAAAIVVAAGSPISVEESGAPEGVPRVDRRMLHLLRAPPSAARAGSGWLARHAGRAGQLVVEFHVPDGPGAYFTLLFPIRVAPPDDVGVLALSFVPYERNHLVSVSGVDVPGQVDSRMPLSGANYEFVPVGPIKVTPARPSSWTTSPWRSRPATSVPAVIRENPPEHLYELALPDAARLPMEAGEYYVELAVSESPCSGCQDEPVEFLIPVRVVAGERDVEAT